MEAIAQPARSGFLSRASFSRSQERHINQPNRLPDGRILADLWTYHGRRELARYLATDALFADNEVGPDRINDRLAEAIGTYNRVELYQTGNVVQVPVEVCEIDNRPGLRIFLWEPGTKKSRDANYLLLQFPLQILGPMPLPFRARRR